MIELIRPLVWCRARRNTALSVSAVRIARGIYRGCPPGVVRDAARQPSMASSVNHTVRLPRWRKLASYARQLMSLCFCLGMWWWRCWFSLKGKGGYSGIREGTTVLRHASSGGCWTGPCNDATGALACAPPRCQSHDRTIGRRRNQAGWNGLEFFALCALDAPENCRMQLCYMRTCLPPPTPPAKTARIDLSCLGESYE